MKKSPEYYIRKLQDFYKRSFTGLSWDVWAIALIYLVNRCGEMVIPFMSLYLTDQLDFTKTQTGIVLTCFGVGAFMGSNIGGMLTDRIGNFKVMFISLVGAGLSFMMILNFETFIGLSLWMIVSGTFSSMFSPAAFSAVGQWGKPENVTRGYSLLRMAINLGIAIGPALGGYVAKSIGYSWLFLIDGTTCLLAAGTLFLVLSHRNVPPPPAQEINKEGSRSPYTDGILLAFLLLNLINMVAFFQILFAVPVYFKEVVLLHEDIIGLFFTVNGAIVFFLEMPIVYMIELKNSYFKPLAAGALLIGFGYLSLTLIPNPIIAIICYSLLVAFGEVINFPLIPSLAMRRADASNQGKYMGTVSTMFALAFLLAPISGLPVIEITGYSTYWYLAAGCSFLSFAGLWALKGKFNSMGR